MDNCDEDHHIINEVIAGNREHYRTLILRHENQIFAMLLRQLGNSSLAKEITHETFVKAYFALATFRSESRFSTWLTRIAINCANSHLRSNRNRHKLIANLSTIELTMSGIDDPTSVQCTDFKQSEAALKCAVLKLKPKLRDALTLCALEGKSYQEASEILGIPYGTVCSRMNSALRVLRRNMKGRLP